MAQGIEVHARVIRQIYNNGDYYIFALIPTEKNDSIKLNSYGNFTVTGELGYLSMNKEYDFILKEGQTNQYGTSYSVIDVPSMKLEDLKKLSYEDKYEILKECTSSDKIAKNILEAYPDYIEIAVNQGADAIDTKKIYGVGKVYNNSYCRKLISKYKYYTFCRNTKMKDYDFSVSEAKALFDKYGTAEDIIKAMSINPYYNLIEICKRSFDNADELLREVRKDLIDSDIRTEALIMEILKRNEYDGNTRLKGTDLFHVAKEDYNCNNLIPKLKDVAIQSQLIYYDENTTDLSLMSTYIGECNIYDFVTRKTNEKPIISDEEIEQYRSKFNSLTDEQFGALQMLNKHEFSILAGSAGCVDRDTEFFNGNEWKKICDYKQGDKVLQYNDDGTGELVEPNYYIKLPCNKMYHFETKYGINQTLSADHTMIFNERHNHKIFRDELIEIKTEDFVRQTRQGIFPVHKDKFRTTFIYDGKGIDLSDVEIKIMCAVICDGSFQKGSPTSKRCRFHIKKDRKKEELKHLFIEANLDYIEHKSAAEGFTDFYVDVPRREKYFSSYWYNCSQHQLQIICDNILQWDGSCQRGRKNFSTTIKKTADFIQFAFSACGMRATIQTYDRRGEIKTTNKKIYQRKSIEYNISITDKTLVGLNHYHNNITPIEEVKTIDGFKYCFNVPSHKLILRRGDKIFITGNCGKTFTVNSLIQFCDEQGLSYTLLAPTGSAALRLHESTHRDAMTIHLKCLRDQDIHTDVLIVDECSMIDLKTFNMMINTISNDNIRVVLVGDKSQLTPVGIGCVFADLINSHKVPITELTKVFRYNDNGILYIATNTRQGRFCLDDNVVTHRKNSYSIGQMYHFYEMQNDDSVDESILEKINETYNKLLLKGVPKKDILILSAYNVGDCGVNKINSVIQAEVNPPSSQKKEFKKGRGVVFRVDDRVINTKNDYNAIPLDSYNQIEASNGVITGDDVPTTTLFNGQRGVVVEIRDKAMICDFEGEMIAIDRSKIQYIKLAYAITYHKSQGQEADYVISVVSPTQSRLLTRNLLYVGETRAKKAQYDIGTLDAMQQALSIDGIEIRDTWLNYLFQHSSIDNQ